MRGDFNENYMFLLLLFFQSSFEYCEDDIHAQLPDQKQLQRETGKLGTSKRESVEKSKNTVRVDERGDERGRTKREGRGREGFVED